MDGMLDSEWLEHIELSRLRGIVAALLLNHFPNDYKNSSQLDNICVRQLLTCNTYPMKMPCGVDRIL